VLLGASNLTLALPTVIETCRELLRGPLDINAVSGHGRSYGLDSYVLVRGLSSIRESTVWPYLQNAPRLPTYSLIADVGNDIMYGVAPEVIAEWVEWCVEQLHAVGARQVMTSLPMERLAHMSPTNFQVARAVFFPTRRLTMADAMARAKILDGLLRDVAARRSIPSVEFPREWYGWDPIHMPRAHRSEAWGLALGHWIDPNDPPEVHAVPSLTQAMRVRLSAPDRWWLFGRFRRGRRQPLLHLEDGTTVSLR
jgi:hypothetical protein